MLSQVKERTGRMGDALLARLAPRMDAEAVCGSAQKCCSYLAGNGGWWWGWFRWDPEHENDCTPCITNFRGCPP